MSSFWAIMVAIVVGGLLVWAFAGVLSVAFHIAEYAALALVAGWVGYKLGHSAAAEDTEGPDRATRPQTARAL